MSEKKFEVLVQIRAALTQQDIDNIMVVCPRRRHQLLVQARCRAG